MMARAWRIARITLGCGALLFAAPGTDAVTLGKAELRSRLGEPLEARIPLAAEPGEALRGACFSLLTGPQGPLAASGARLELRHHAHGADLYVRSRAPLSDPEVAFAIALSCPGARGIDPVRYSLALSAASPMRAATIPPVLDRAAAPLPVVARLSARSGDTLASIAHAIFPGNAEARARYMAAMRRQNSALSGFGDDQPLTEGTQVALPDLHAFAATIPPSHAPRLAAAVPHAASKPSSPAVPRLAQTLSAPRASEPPRSAGATRTAARGEAASPVRTAAAPANPSAARGEDGFQLRLSAPVMDLSPSDGMDERKRAELRERLLVLEADDRTAAMLAMRENIRRLESQVSALKLKLATLETAPLAKPQSAAPKAEPVPPRPPSAAPKAELVPPKPQPVAPMPEPVAAKPQASAPKADAPAPVAQPPKVAKPEAPVAKQPAPAAKAEPPAKAAAAPARSPAPARTEASRDRPAAAQPWYLDRLWLAALATILIVAWVVLRARVRSAEEPEIIEPPTEVPEAEGASALPDTEAPPTTEPHDLAAGEEPEMATRVPADDHAELRRRYMEERFPEIVNGTLVLEDERSVVKAARLLYDDGAAPRAIELLQFAIEQDPEALHPWLALFEIFRLEKLEGEFAHLAARFRDRHGATDEWRKVRSVGRSLDPGNPLYQGTEYGAPADPEAEGWLRSPSDDAGRALAGELRAKLLSEAGVNEADLRDDPTPALRKAEMFSVA
jgi:pilus assembly protein FimV